MMISFESIELKVLVLEDSPHDLELMREQLLDAGYHLDLIHVDNEKSFISALLNNPFDIILSDFSLPGFDAFEALKISSDICPNVPFICISGSIGEETAIELLKLGAVDYVLKDRPERLPFAVKRALDEAQSKEANRKAAKALFESDLRFKQVVENAQAWIWEVDNNGLFIYSSSVISSLLGFTVEETVGKKYFYDFFIPSKREELKEAALGILMRRESFMQFDNSCLHKNGQIVFLATSGSPFFDDDGNLLGYRGVNANITERNKMIEELERAKKRAEESDKLKTAFINNISHEIRTPLNSILGFGQFLCDPELPWEERNQYFSIIKNSSNRLMNTVSDYIEMAMIVTGTIQIHHSEFSLQRLFKEIVEYTKPLCADKNLSFEKLEPTIPGELILNSDNEFIQKTFHILIANALKFTTQGTITLGYKFDNEFIEFFVQDTGTGIAADKMKIIFNMFSQEDPSNTRGYEGSGLGLSIAMGLVKLLGGTINVTSKKGTGSRFTFTVPISFQSFQ